MVTAASSPAEEAISCGDHSDHAGDRSPVLPTAAEKALHEEAVCRRNAQQVGEQLGRLVEVVRAESSDPARIAQVLEAALERALEGDEADEREQRQNKESEGVERRSQVCCSREQSEGHQAAADRTEKHRRPPRRLGDRRCTSALQSEVLSGEERDGGRPRIPLRLRRRRSELSR